MTSASGMPESARVPDAGSAAEAGEVGLTVAAVARRLGVAPATLRTWDRRYGLGPSAHSAGAHRRYGTADIARLEHMRRLVLSGVSPGDAARAALALDVQSVGEGTSPQPAPTELPSDPAGSRQGGGRVLAMPGGTPAARGLARAAVSLDSQACEQIITETLERRGVVWTWDHLLVPVLIGVGQRWEATGSGIEVEHVLSEATQAILSRRVHQGFTPVNARPVLLASSGDEMHTLPLWAVAAGLAERRVAARMLGARTPSDALSAAVRRTGPAAILLWSQTPETGELSIVDDLPDLRPDPIVLLAGPGWQPGSTPARRVYDLTGAVQAIAHAVGA